jgi:hypothetical protein
MTESGPPPPRWQQPQPPTGEQPGPAQPPAEPVQTQPVQTQPVQSQPVQTHFTYGGPAQAGSAVPPGYWAKSGQRGPAAPPARGGLRAAVLVVLVLLALLLVATGASFWYAQTHATSSPSTVWQPAR